MNTEVIPAGIEKRILCARFYERIKAFYENPANQRRFEEWQARRQGPDDLCKTESLDGTQALCIEKN